MDYGVPEAIVHVNDGEELSPVSVLVAGARMAPIGRAVVELDLEGEALAVKAGDRIEVLLGYRETGVRRVFKGKVKVVDPGRVVRLTCLDRMQDLGEPEARIRQSFVSVTAQDVMSWCLERAGVDEFTLGAGATPRRHHFVCKNLSVLQVCKMVRESWGLDWDYYADPDGVVWFVPWAESPRALADPVLDLEYGVNITRWQPSTNSTGILETYLAPEVRHSDRIRITDDRLSGLRVVARVERATHELDKVGGCTRIEWTVLTAAS